MFFSALITLLMLTSSTYGAAINRNILPAARDLDIDARTSVDTRSDEIVWRSDNNVVFAIKDEGGALTRRDASSTGAPSDDWYTLATRATDDSSSDVGADGQPPDRWYTLAEDSETE